MQNLKAPSYLGVFYVCADMFYFKHKLTMAEYNNNNNRLTP